MKHSLKLCAILLVVIGCLPLCGCNTTKGVGTDIQKAGEGLKNSAERNGAR
jgi:predicted small secreted protein